MAGEVKTGRVADYVSQEGRIKLTEASRLMAVARASDWLRGPANIRQQERTLKPHEVALAKQFTTS